MTTAIDTLRIFERLRDAELPERAAKEIAEVFKENIEEHLATRTDITTVKAEIEKMKLELEATIAKTKVEIIKWVAGMLVTQAVVVAALVKIF
jgi:hypothetical protein